MGQCLFCCGSLTHHAMDCRTHSDMDLFQRVHERLVREGRNRELQDNLHRYLALYGRPSAAQAAE